MRRAGLTLLLLSAGCAGARPVPQPASLEQGAIVARVALKGAEMPNWRRHQADKVYWAKVNAYGDLDLDHPLETKLAREGDVYLFDLPPGKYAPFAAEYPSLGVRFLARLEPEVRKKMQVEVGGGRVVFAGDVLVRTEWEGFLPALEHQGLRLAFLVPPFNKRAVEVATRSPRFDESPMAEIAALRRARKVAAGTLWVEKIDERIVELGNPADPLTTGLIRKKVVPATVSEAGRFAYVDTLGWGAPRSIDGGLEWREPKGQAKVAVAFIAYSSTRTLEKQLETLRLAGSPEDEHVLYEVRVGSLPARSARFTTYSYGTEKLVGAETAVHVTEAVVVGRPKGYYLLLYRASKDAFDRFHEGFFNFVKRLKFLA